VSNHSVQVSDNTTNKSATLPVLSGTLGPPTIDIGKLHKETGLFTYDPGFMSPPRAAAAPSPTSTAMPAC
jgi:citrate synthase